MGVLAIQLKNDEQHEFLGMVSFRIPLGGNSKKDLLKDRVMRKYMAPVYKADPDDFGIGLFIAGSILAGSIEGSAAVAASAAAADATAMAAVAGGTAKVISAVKK